MELIISSMKHNVDFQAHLTKCKGLIQDLRLVTEAVLDKGVENEYTLNAIVGLQHLYELKFDDFFETYRCSLQYFVEQGITCKGDLEEKLLNCWSILDDLQVLHDSMQESSLTADEISNVLIGLEYLGDMKFKQLEKEVNYITTLLPAPTEA